MSKEELPTYVDAFEREAANDQVTDKAYGLLWERAVKPWQYKQADNKLELWGSVVDGRRKYDTTVTLNTREREVLEYSCTCEDRALEKRDVRPLHGVGHKLPGVSPAHL